MNQRIQMYSVLMKEVTHNLHVTEITSENEWMFQSWRQLMKKKNDNNSKLTLFLRSQVCVKVAGGQNEGQDKNHSSVEVSKTNKLQRRENKQWTRRVRGRYDIPWELQKKLMVSGFSGSFISFVTFVRWNYFWGETCLFLLFPPLSSLVLGNVTTLFEIANSSYNWRRELLASSLCKSI